MLKIIYVLVDDIIDTAGTACYTAKILKEAAKIFMLRVMVFFQMEELKEYRKVILIKL